jgi:hypothetical protein
VIDRPNREIEVVVGATRATGVEVDGPPAEQPVFDPLTIEPIANRAERGELGVLGHTISFA